MSSATIERPEEVPEVVNEDDVDDLDEEDEVEDINTTDRETDDDTDFSTYKERLAVKPSTNVWDFWIICHDLQKRNSLSLKDGTTGDGNTRQIGKYLIFEDEKHIDESWEKIKTATESGLLGFASKVATKKEKPKAIGGQSDSQVICVYARYTATDESDKVRVLQGLRNLGYNRHLPYKADSDTNAGTYSDKNKKGGDDVDESCEVSEEESEYSAAETDTSRGDFSGRGSDQGSDAESEEYAELPKKHKSDAAQKSRGENKPTEYVRMYTTHNTYTLDVYLHIKQMDSTAQSGKQDILFPMDQANEIGESVYQLGHAVLTDDEDTVDGITTSHVKLWVGYSTDFNAHSVFIKSTKCDSMVSFPQADAVFYYNRIEWYRKHRSS